MLYCREETNPTSNTTTILLYYYNVPTILHTILLSYISLYYYTILRTVILIWTSISGRLFSGQQKWRVKHHGDSLIHCFTVIRGAISWNSTPVELGGLSYCKILVTGASTSQAEDFFHQQHVFWVYLHSTMPVESETKQNSPPNYKWTSSLDSWVGDKPPCVPIYGYQNEIVGYLSSLWMCLHKSCWATQRMFFFNILQPCNEKGRSKAKRIMFQTLGIGRELRRKFPHVKSHVFTASIKPEGFEELFVPDLWDVIWRILTGVSFLHKTADFTSLTLGSFFLQFSRHHDMIFAWNISHDIIQLPEDLKLASAKGGRRCDFEMPPSFDRLPLFVCQILPGGNDDDDDDVVAAAGGGVYFFSEHAFSSWRTKRHFAYANHSMFACADKDHFAPFPFK